MKFRQPNDLMEKEVQKGPGKGGGGLRIPVPSHQGHFLGSFVIKEVPDGQYCPGAVG